MTIWNFSEEESQDCNDKIAIFMGGVLESSLVGEQYRFPIKSAPYQHAIVLPRKNGNTRVMRFHDDYNHLMWVIKKCEQEQHNTYLGIKYKNIQDTLLEVSLFNHVAFLHRAVTEFIDVYNESNETNHTQRITG